MTMAYQGYRSRTEVFEWVCSVFPFQPKPQGFLLTNLGPEDSICQYIVEYMDQYSGAKIPPDGIRYLHSELSNLSVQGVMWLLPNLLRKAVISDNRFDTMADVIISDLEAAAEGDYRAGSRYAWLSADQRQCLEEVLEYLSETHGYAVATAIHWINQACAESARK